MSMENTRKMKVMDMTEGNILKHILIFAFPIFIGNIFQQIYSVVDTMIAGYCLGDSAIAAIGATSSMTLLIINFAWGMNSGFALVVTRAFGGHNLEHLQKAIAGTFLLDGIVTAILTALALFFSKDLMLVMHTPADIYEDAHEYLIIICAGMLATVAYNMFSSILRAVGNSITPLYFLIFSSILNVALDFAFVAGLKMGVGGAALATVIAEGVSAVLSGIYFVKNYKPMIPERRDYRISGNLMKELVTNGGAMAFMYSVVDLGSVFFQSANNALAATMGNGVITAHTTARRIIGITMAPLTTITTAGATFIGQNWGAGKKDRVREGLKKETMIVVLTSIIECVLIYAFGTALVRLITGTYDAEIIKNTVMSLRIHHPFYPLLGILFALRTTLQAVDIKMPTVVSSGIELGMKILSAFVIIPTLHFLGTCITEPIIWTMCAIFLIGVYFAVRRRLKL